ncbi:MAG: alpha/beta hydrolase [bacterium]
MSGTGQNGTGQHGTIVMIHGMWGRAEIWGEFRTYFEARGYRCDAVTLRHHGGDPAAPPHPELGTTSILDYAADLEKTLRQYPEPPIVMGWSMGGLLAQMLAARGLAKAVVLLMPAPPAGVFALKLSVIRGFLSGLTRWAFWRKSHRQTFGEAAYSMLHLMPENERRPIYDAFGYESGRAAAEIGFWLLDRTRASRVDPAQVTCPVLVVAGKEDRIVPASVVKQVARRYRAEYVEMENHAHWVVAEPGWRDVAAVAADWLEKTLPTEIKTEAKAVPAPTPPPAG